VVNVFDRAIAFEFMEDFERCPISILNDWTSFFMSVLRISLYFRNRCYIILRKMVVLPRLGAVGRFWVWASHTCFGHSYHLNHSICKKASIIRWFFWKVRTLNS